MSPIFLSVLTIYMAISCHQQGFMEERIREWVIEDNSREASLGTPIMHFFALKHAESQPPSKEQCKSLQLVAEKGRL